jgi:hypothetical protein
MSDIARCAVPGLWGPSRALLPGESVVSGTIESDSVRFADDDEGSVLVSIAAVSAARGVDGASDRLKRQPFSYCPALPALQCRPSSRAY